MPTGTPPRTTARLKPALGLTLAVVALGALAIGLAREASRASHSGPLLITGEAESGSAVPALVTVYYFHGDTRCPTCLAIESESRRVIHEHFGTELELGMLRFVAVNFDTPASRHFRTEYGLAFGTVLIQGEVDERPWENLAEVWKHIHNDPASFEDYLIGHIRAMLDRLG
jgi:hypothetical protein